MPVAFIRSNFVRQVASVVCLFVFPLAAQQANTSLSMQPAPAPVQGGNPPGAPTANAPEPKVLPQPTHVDYSRPTPLLPNPFARYISRDVPPPAFTNSPKIEQLIQNGKLLLSLNDAIAIALADNLDIAVARYNLPIADTDILRTKAGEHSGWRRGRRWFRCDGRRRRWNHSRRWRSRRRCRRLCGQHQRCRPPAG